MNMFEKVLIANRGAVAARVLRSLRALGIRSVAVYSEADAAAPYLDEADETFAIGPAHPRESYLNQDALIAVLRQSGADAVHPGYGFLAENPDFAERVAAAGATFIGPSPRWISAMGHKTRARDLVAHQRPAEVVGMEMRDQVRGDAVAVGGRHLHDAVDVPGGVHDGALARLRTADEVDVVGHRPHFELPEIDLVAHRPAFRTPRRPAARRFHARATAPIVTVVALPMTIVEKRPE